MTSLDDILRSGRKLIQLDPGVYECRGWAGAFIPSGTTLRGAGIGATTLLLSRVIEDPYGGYNTALLSEDSSRNISVSDLTIDCNHHGLGVRQSTLQGIVLRGGDHLIERVRVINAAGAWANPDPANNPESFVIAIFASPDANGRSLTIRDCVVEEFQLGSCTAICTSYSQQRPPLAGTICRIENNTIRLALLGGQFGLGMAGCQHGLITANTVIGGNRGFNYESADSDHLIVSRNAFLNQYNIAALLGGGSNSLFTDNIIQMIDGGVHKIALMVSGPNSSFSGVNGWLVARNLFISHGKSTATTVSTLSPAAKPLKGSWRFRDNDFVGKWAGIRKA